LLSKSWPLIISSAAAILYLKIDQFMLGQMLGMASVGTYAVAARLSEVWYFIPAAVAAAIFPRLVELKSSDPAQYERRIKDSLRYVLWLSLAIALPVSFAAPFIIVALYGDPFREAGLILAIHVWACPAVFMGMIIEKWFVTEDLLKFLIWRQLGAATLNIALNLLLIPLYGGVGAAVATVIAYSFAYYLSCFTSRKTTSAGQWMTEAIVWPLRRLTSR
jgi:PST family polysaccharide transporter